MTEKPDKKKTKENKNGKFSEFNDSGYRSIVENTGFGIASVDIKGRFTFVNKALCKMIGYTEKELLGRPFADFLHPDDKKRIMQLFLSAWENPTKKPEIKFRVIHKKGHSVDLYACPTISFHKDSIIGFNSIIVDITERKKIEEELRLEEARYRDLVEKSGIGILVDDKDGNFKYCNQKFLDIFGYTAQEMKQQSIETVVHPGDVKKVLTNHKKRIKGEKAPSRYEFRGIRKDGAVVYLEVDVVPLTNERQIIGTRSYVWDTTDRKTVEWEMEENIKMYQQLADSITDIFFALDKDLKYTFWNRASEELTGISAKDAIGKSILDIFPDNKQTKNAIKHYKDVMKKQTPCVFVNEYTINGKNYFFEIHAYPTADGVSAFVKDITDKKRADDKIKAAEEKFRTIFESTNDVIIFVDKRGRILNVNKVVEDIFGYKRDDLLGKNVFKLGVITKKNLPNIFKTFKDAVRNGRIKGNTDTYIMGIILNDKNGNEIYVETSSKIVKKDGKLVGFVSILRDMTARKTIEEKLRESEEKYRNIVEMAPDGIVTVDLKGIITDINTPFCERTGYSKEELVGKHISKMPTAQMKDVPKYLKLFKEILTGKVPKPFEFQWVHRDGTVHWGEVRVSIMKKSGKVIGFQAITRDITERKQAQKALLVSHHFLEIVNKHTKMIPLLKEFVIEIQNFTDCAAVGLRMLDEEGNIPYESYVGFSRRFYESESPLSIKSDQCMCINVIKGMTNPKLSFYTEGGSFYMNATTSFLATVSEEEKGQTRNVCNEFGYESVALVPIRIGKHILGLIHIADPRKDMVHLEMVKVLEGVAMQLATAIQRVQMREALTEANKQLQVLQETAAAVHSTLDLQKVFKQITDGFVFSLDYTSAFILIKNKERKCFEMRDFATKQHLLPQINKILGYPIKNFTLPLETEYNATIKSVMNGKIMIAKTLTEVAYPFIKKKICSALQKLGGTKNYIVIPLNVGKKLVGGVVLSSAQKEITKEEIKIIETFAHVASSAIENADLHARTKQTVAALQESEEKFRTLTENIPGFAYRCLSDWNMSIIGKGIGQITGYQKKDFIDKKIYWLDIVHHDDKNKVMEKCTSLVNRECQIEQEYRIVRKNSTVIWVKDIKKSVHKDGKFDHVDGIIFGITERKRAEEMLRQNEEKYRHLVENINDVIYTTDRNGIITYISPTVEQLFGYKPDEIIGQQYTKFVVNQDLPRIMIQFQKVISGQIEPSEYRMITKHGEIKWVRTSSRPIYKGSKVIGLQGVLTDITEQREVQQQIAHGKKEWEATFDAITDPIIITDEYFVIDRVNLAFARRLKKNFTEIIGKKCYELIKKDKKRCEQCPMVANIESPRPFIFTFDNLAFPGSFMCSTYMTKIEGQEYIVHYFRDITQEKEAEKTLRELNWRILNAQEEERKRIAQELHDELSQTLTALKLDASWLKSQLKELDSLKKERLDSLVETTDGLIEKVKGICFELRPATLDEIGLVNALEKAVEDFTIISEIKCQVNCRGEVKRITPETAIIAYRITGEALTNVLRHAEASEISIDVVVNDNRLTLSISDNGSGISTADLKAKKSLGIHGMMERASSIGGNLVIEPGLISGTVVKATLPLK